MRKWINSAGGRKWLGFLVATAALFFGKLSSEAFIVCFAIFVGGNVAQKALLAKYGAYDPYRDYAVGGTDE